MQHLGNIQNIIFDFGNVLFDLRLERLESCFRELLGHNFEPAMRQLKADKVFETYETGGMDTAEFVDVLRHAAQPSVSPQAVVAAWNAIFVEMPAHRFQLLEQLRTRYQVFLLSNINDLHARWIDGYMLREHHLHDFHTRFFDGIYYSHWIRLRKPQREIFEYVMADAELQPETCVFFDDLPENVAAAQALGIRGFIHPVGTEIATHLSALGL